MKNKQELLLGGIFWRGYFSLEKSRKPRRRKKGKKHKLLRGGQPFGKGTFHWKNQETQEKKERTLVN